MLAATGRLLEAAREERRPAVIEAITYRYRGHSVADAGFAYRTKEEVEEWQAQRDPIDQFARMMRGSPFGERELVLGKELGRD